jgi:hypothetical protein
VQVLRGSRPDGPKRSSAAESGSDGLKSILSVFPLSKRHKDIMSRDLEITHEGLGTFLETNVKITWSGIPIEENANAKSPAGRFFQ